MYFFQCCFQLDTGSHKNISKLLGMLKPMNDNNNNNHESINGNSNISGSNNSTGSSQLLIQCGGYRNLHQIIKILKRITQLDQFKEYFRNWKQPWYFAKPDDTYKLLAEICYVNTTAYLYSDRVIFPNRLIYAKFVKTVVMKPI